MSTYSGPEIIDNGLVLAYDMLNTQKAWRGPPVTNYIPFPQASHNGSSFVNFGYNYANLGATYTYVTEVDNPVNATGVLEYFTGTTGYKYFSVDSTSLPTTGTYTFSYYARVITSGSASMRPIDGQLWRANGSDRSVTGDWNPTFTSEWRRYVTTGPAEAATILQYFPVHSGSIIGGYKIQYCGFQLELGSYATPFVVGARSNTQAIVDLTGNNSITTTSLTYASNGTFSFNGSSNYIDSGPVALTGTSTQSITWACWVRPAAGAGDIINMVSGGWNMCPMWASGQVFNAKVWSNPTLTSGATFTLDQYYYLVLVRNNDTNTNSFYINGQLVASNIGAYNSSGSANNHYFGRAGAQATNTFFNGLIPKAQIYTRALTAAEVQINFNAYRGRYGL